MNTEATNQDLPRTPMGRGKLAIRLFEEAVAAERNGDLPRSLRAERQLREIGWYVSFAGYNPMPEPEAEAKP